MQITQISYQKTFNLGNYSSERIGAEITLNAGEDAMQAINEARKLVMENFTANNLQPEILPEPEIPIIPKQKQMPIETTVDFIKRDINSCTELKVLESYRLIAAGKPELKEAYDNKLIELQNK